MAEFDAPSNLIAQRGAFYKMAKDAGLIWKQEVPHFVRMLLWAPPCSSGSQLWRSRVKEWGGDKVGELLTFRVSDYLSKDGDENEGFDLTWSTLHFCPHLTTLCLFQTTLLLPDHVCNTPCLFRLFYILSLLFLSWKRGWKVLTRDVLYLAFILTEPCACVWEKRESFASLQTEVPAVCLIHSSLLCNQCWGQ